MVVVVVVVEVSIRCQKTPGGWYTPYTNTPLLLGKHKLAYVNMTSFIKGCSIKYLTTRIELVLPAFFNSKL